MNSLENYPIPHPMSGLASLKTFLCMRFSSRKARTDILQSDYKKMTPFLSVNLVTLGDKRHPGDIHERSASIVKYRI